MIYNIAICDDSEVDRLYISGLVEKWGTQTGHVTRITRFSSAENFLFLYAEKCDYHILLLDIEMGNMDGVTMAKQLRKENGLDTMIYKNLSDDGVEVSGGEAQKIAIARALYKDAPFIILDEPTAALDPVAEAEIYSKFNEISGDKTAVYISHRLSSCKFCDEIVVFHRGTVIQRGTHRSLVADESGKYYQLWNAQAQYYREA